MWGIYLESTAAEPRFLYLAMLNDVPKLSNVCFPSRQALHLCLRPAQLVRHQTSWVLVALSSCLELCTAARPAGGARAVFHQGSQGVMSGRPQLHPGSRDPAGGWLCTKATQLARLEGARRLSRGLGGGRPLSLPLSLFSRGASSLSLSLSLSLSRPPAEAAESRGPKIK